jgi:predicted TIM-barrel fold metal-dependent hydrolase
MAMAGVFERLPKLRIYWAESQAGWLPYSLAQIDDNYERNRYWGERLYGIEAAAHPPSHYLKTHCLWGFMKDPHAVRMRHDVGVNQLIWGSDSFHATGDWPHSREVIDSMFAGVPEDERYRMLAGNVIDFFHLDAVSPQVPAVSAGHAI